MAAPEWAAVSGVLRGLSEVIAPARLGTRFRWLLASSWVSNIGDGIAVAAGPLLVASQTSSPILVASAATVQYVPSLLFGLHAGALVDRLDRRRVIVAANLIRAVVVALLCTFILVGWINIIAVLVALFLMGMAELFADNASSAVLPTVVKTEDLTVGNVRLQAGFLTANQFLGPPVGALLFAAGMVLPFGVQTITILLAALLISRIALPRPERAAEETGTLHQDIVAGLRWLYRNQAVRTLALVIFIFNLTFAAPWSLLVLYATKHLHLPPLGYGMLTTAAAIGGIIGTVSCSRLTRRFSYASVMKVCLSLEVVMHLTLALNTSGYVAIGVMVGFGCYAFIWGTISQTLRQRLVPDHYRGRISAIYRIAVFGGLVLGSALGGVIAHFGGLTAPWWFAFVGAGITLALVWRQLSHIAATPAQAGKAPD